MAAAPAPNHGNDVPNGPDPEWITRDNCPGSARKGLTADEGRFERGSEESRKGEANLSPGGPGERDRVRLSAVRDGDRDLESVGIGQGDVAEAPGLVRRPLIEPAALRLDPLREIVHAAPGHAEDAEALSFFPLAALL